MNTLKKTFIFIERENGRGIDIIYKNLRKLEKNH